MITTEVLTQHERPPLLAWLSNEAGGAVSNAVAIDDPNALERSLASATHRVIALKSFRSRTPKPRSGNSWLVAPAVHLRRR